jgi:hypothetical protein
MSKMSELDIQRHNEELDYCASCVFGKGCKERARYRGSLTDSVKSCKRRKAIK